MSSTRTKNRTNTLAVACIIACFFFAYGFSNKSSLFQWKLPLTIMIVTAAWTFMPRLVKGRETSERA